MTVRSRIYGRLAALPPATTHRVRADRDLRIPMPDGTILLADRLYPDVAGGDRAPIVLARTPYGRDTYASAVAWLFAERGFQAVTVSCRGTFGAGGDWVPFRNEQRDGHAVLAWLADQPWFTSAVCGISGSYCGLTQWAVAGDAPPWLKGLAPAVSASNFREMLFPGGSFALLSALVWLSGLEQQEAPGVLRRLGGALTGLRQIPRGADTIPLKDSDAAMVGRTVEWFQDWLAHDGTDDPWWEPINFGRNLTAVPPTSMMAGWYDVFLPSQLDDFKALRDAGRQVRLTVGPWTHSNLGGGAAVIRDSLEWASNQLLGQPAACDRGDVRLFVLGTNRWVDLPDWPPPATSTRWYLHPQGVLSPDAPVPSAPDSYRYDPSDPTPSIGGASLHPMSAGPKDNRHREARSDVLTYTTEPLRDDVTVAGEVTAELYVAPSVDYTDLVVRLCDVNSRGTSVNLSDGVVRLCPDDIDRRPNGASRVTIRMFPTAATFARGHRIRLQVSSGAHPLYARNTGSGEPLGKATTLVVADIDVCHDPQRPSAVTLPLLETPIRPRRRRGRPWTSRRRS